jgi:hypothetical protein
MLFLASALPDGADHIGRLDERRVGAGTVTEDQEYAFARPGLVTHKRRKLELAAGPVLRGNHRQPGAGL